MRRAQHARARDTELNVLPAMSYLPGPGVRPPMKARGRRVCEPSFNIRQSTYVCIAQFVAFFDHRYTAVYCKLQLRQRVK